MRYYNLLDLKLQELSVFTVTAEFESITKAANYLYLTPSQVSKIIKKLENQWGVALFLRDKNNLRLTPAGKHAYKGLRGTLDAVQKTLDEVVQIQAVKPFIRIGCPTLGDPSCLFPPMIQRFLQTEPNAEITMECTDHLALLRKMLLAQEVDLIYTSDFEIAGLEEVLQWKEMQRDPLYAVVNAENPAAQNPSLSIEDLAHAQFVLVHPASDAYNRFVVDLCSRHGFTPNICRYVHNVYSQLMEVSINPNAVCIAIEREKNQNPNLCYCPLPNLFWQMGFAYRADAHPIVHRFVSQAQF